MSGWQVKDGSKWSLIGKQNPQLPEMFYPVADPDMVITKKDFVAARCTMVSNLGTVRSMRNHRFVAFSFSNKL